MASSKNKSHELPPGESRKTTDHNEIKRWVESRGGRPACVKGTGPDQGILRVDFVGFGAGEESLQPISWEDFFEKFDREKLAFLHQDKTKDGGDSRFFKLVER
jgi:hypothetical protein